MESHTILWSSFLDREQEERIIDDSPGTGYEYGVSIKTAKMPNSDVAMYGVLTLPQPTISGQCLQTAPVRFLKNLDSSCSYTMTNNTCGPGTVLSSFFYIQNSSMSTGFSPLVEDDGLVIAETNVNYYCAPNANAYINSSAGITNVVGRVLFDYNLPANPNCTDICGNDLCVDLNNLDDPDLPASSSLPPLCSNQQPSHPTIAVDECNNSVVEVQYTFTWEGKKIIKLDANIILANVPLSRELTQKHSVTYVHNFTGVSSDATDNFNNITDTSYARSGKVGYEIGKPIFSGSKVNNESVSPPEFMYINTNRTRQMAIFSPGKNISQEVGKCTFSFVGQAKILVSPG